MLTSGRVDFLINGENIVIETKMTRKSFKDKQIGDELIVILTDTQSEL